VFKPVPTRVDYVQLEHGVQDWWDENGILAKYLQRNANAEKRFSFIDGPITANNPMGVHHAWGRSYKDLYQRFKTMRGYRQRYQNGFDCQGLWIEVEVEKDLGFRNKKDIEKFGVAEFVDACKQRVHHFAGVMTEQSIRLGYWMDWDNSYFTNSDENNYTIWSFLKKCWQNGWLYKGKDTMPWCPRCGTGISQHEIVTEGYQETRHKSVYLKFPITGRQPDGQIGNSIEQAGNQASRQFDAGTSTESLTPALSQGEREQLSPSPQAGRGPGGGVESFLVWTTTPWTLPANVAAAVNTELTYLRVRQGEDVFYVSKGALGAAVRGEHEVLGEVQGSELVGLTYRGPFDELEAQEGVRHRVIEWNEVSDAEGTGIVHIAPGAGAEDFALAKLHSLDVIAPLDELGNYVSEGFGFLEGRFAWDVAEDVFASLNEKGVLYRVEDFTHRYPHCWRCGSELVFRLVDEWFISMDELRFKIMEITRKARWIPEFGMARELDWLRNMHDWMISKKRYYGLALPIYECKDCNSFEVIGSEVELQERAVVGWQEFEGHSPHRPWVDAVKIACPSCGGAVERIKDVGNPWLDAGIVPYSTLDYRHDRSYWQEWFPADWVSESFPGQFRNWFYAMLAMSAVMEEREPFKTLFGYALLRDERGEEMHKSKGNAIEFIEAAERMGADVMRWMFLRANPVNNLNFGWHGADELKRGFLSTLWNTYSFFVTYANIDGWTPQALRARELDSPSPRKERGPGGEVSSSPSPAAGRGPGAGVALTDLDRWALSELNQLVATCTSALEAYDSMTACRAIEEFVEGLSNWYVRRSRRRFWKGESDDEKQAAYETLWTCLATLTRLMAPLTPFLAEEMYRNLVAEGTRDQGPAAGLAESVHLSDWPEADESLIDKQLSDSVRLVQRLSSLGRAARAKANLKVRQPLAAVHVRVQNDVEAEIVRNLADQVTEELNVKALQLIQEESEFFEYDVRPNLSVLGPKYGSALGKIRSALEGADKAAIASEVGAGRPVVLDGFTLQPGELLVSMSGKPGYAVVGEAGYAVAVTTEVTPELADEGLARELVRRIQEMRKTAGFDLADRILVGHEADAEITRVLDEWGSYVRQETLATTVIEGGVAGYAEEHEIDGRKVRITVEKAAATGG
jgi:isoleucyl-tRNA synthetase